MGDQHQARAARSTSGIRAVGLLQVEVVRSPAAASCARTRQPAAVRLTPAGRVDQDERWVVSHMTNAELRVIPGVWGHFAGGGPNPVDTAFIDAAVRELL